MLKDRGFTEGDWRLFRNKLPEWQEAYMDGLNREYIQLLSDSRAPSENFWELERRIREDKHRAGVCLEMRQSVMLDNIIRLLREGVITVEDINDFSDELKDAVRFVSGNADI